MIILPKILHMLYEQDNELKAFYTLETLITMGEKCPPKWLVSWLEKNPKLKIKNGYGPTETTIAATMTDLDRDLILKAHYAGNLTYDVLHMQTALRGVQLYFLEYHSNADKERKLITMADCKELCTVEIIIGGNGVGQYIVPKEDKQKSTATQFIIHLQNSHFLRKNSSGNWYYQEIDNEQKEQIITINGEIPEGNYYRTGNLAELKPTGELLFLQRIDRCVKRNGVFTVLPQVEAAMNQCEFIKWAVAFAVNDHCLAVFIMPKSATITAEDTSFCTGVFTAIEHMEVRLQPTFCFLLQYETEINQPKRPGSLAAIDEKTVKFLVPPHSSVHPPKEEKITQLGKKIAQLEKKVAQVWQEMLFEDLSDNQNFCRLMPGRDLSTLCQLFNTESDFRHWGGDSLSTLQMIHKVWNIIQPNQFAPAEFGRIICEAPKLGVIARLLYGYKVSANYLHRDLQHGLPLIYLYSSKTLNLHTLRLAKFLVCSIKLPEFDPTVFDPTILVPIIRKIQPIGPYHLAISNFNHQPILQALAKELIKSGKVLQTLFYPENKQIDHPTGIKVCQWPIDRRKREEAIHHYCQQKRGLLLRESCIYKLSKWHQQWLNQKLPSLELPQQAVLQQLQASNHPNTWLEATAYSGKTLILQTFWQILWENFKKSKKSSALIWPIFFDVSGLSNPDCLISLFQQIGFSKEEQDYIRKKNLVLIVDHYDRMLRYDILNLRDNDYFQSFSCLKLIIATRYLAFKKIQQHIAGFGTEAHLLLTSSLSNRRGQALIKKLVKTTPQKKSKVIQTWLAKYLSQEFQRQPRLQPLPLDTELMDVHTFFGQWSRLSLRNRRRCMDLFITNSPWEKFDNHITTRLQTQFRQQTHPYLYLVRGLFDIPTPLIEYWQTSSAIGQVANSSFCKEIKMLPRLLTLDQTKTSHPNTIRLLQDNNIYPPISLLSING